MSATAISQDRLEVLLCVFQVFMAAVQPVLNMATLSDIIKQHICDFFGISTLGEHQSITPQMVLVEKRDALIVWPTGMRESHS